MANQQAPNTGSVDEVLESIESPRQALCEQRELVLVCAWFSFFISLAVLLTNFGPEPVSIPTAREAVEAHRKILVSAREDLNKNEQALSQTRAALAGFEK